MSRCMLIQRRIAKDASKQFLLPHFAVDAILIPLFTLPRGDHEELGLSALEEEMKPKAINHRASRLERPF